MLSRVYKSMVGVAVVCSAMTFTVHARDYNDGFLAAEGGDFKSAVSQWRPLAEEGHAIAQFNLALLYFKKNTSPDIELTDEEKKANWNLSAEYFNKARTIDPNQKMAWELESAALIQMGDWEGAKNTLEKAIEIFPSSKDLWENLSICYSQLNLNDKYKEAAKMVKDLEN